MWSAGGTWNFQHGQNPGTATHPRLLLLPWALLTQKPRAGLWNCFCHSSNHSSSYSIVPLQLKSTPCYSTQFVQWFLKNNPNEKRLHLGDRLLHREPHRQHRPMADKAFKKKASSPQKVAWIWPWTFWSLLDKKFHSKLLPCPISLPVAPVVTDKPY